MVLEAIYAAKRLRDRTWHAFLLGMMYTLLGVVIAFVVLPGYLGLASVAFASILILPSLSNIVQLEEDIERKSKNFDIRMVIKDNYKPIRIFINLFLGSFFAYLICSLAMPGQFNLQFFGPHLGGAGGAVSSSGLFSEILGNNAIVFVLCFALSFLIGSGALFFILWNASVWGVFFGNTAVAAGAAGNQSPILYIAIILAVVMLFVVLEALAYVVASLAGSVLSKSALIEMGRKVSAFSKYPGVIGVLMPEQVHALVQEKWYAEAFSRVVFVNLALLCLGLLLLAAAAAIETAILQNAAIYQDILRLGML